MGTQHKRLLASCNDTAQAKSTRNSSITSVEESVEEGGSIADPHHSIHACTGIQSSGCHSVGPRCMTKARHCLLFACFQMFN
jgi:hypothetical protein